MKKSTISFISAFGIIASAFFLSLPSAVQTVNAQSAASTSPVLAIRQVPVTHPLLIGEKQALFASFNLSAASSSKDAMIFLFKMTIPMSWSFGDKNGHVTLADEISRLSNCGLYSGATKLASGPNGIGTPDTEQLFLLNSGSGLTVKAGTQTQIDFRCDFSSAAIPSGTTYKYEWTLDPNYTEVWSPVNGALADFGRPIYATTQTPTISTAEGASSYPVVVNIYPPSSSNSYQVGNTVNFVAQASTMTAPVAFSWDFGDGQSATAQQIGHTYYKAGAYKATVTATDSAGHISAPVVTEVNITQADQSGCYSFTRNLGLGSTGYDVVLLQNWLIAHGFDIQAISSGQQQKGYFGYETSAALQRYQASIGLPATGFFGSMTISAIGSSCVSNPTAQSSGSASGAQLSASLDSSSPLSSTILISTGSQTQDVPLEVFDLRSNGATSTLQALKIDINTTGQPFPSIFSNITIKIGGRTYTPSSMVSAPGGTYAYAAFENLGAYLPTNEYVPVTVYGTVAQDTNGFLDGSTATASLFTASTTAVGANAAPVPVASYLPVVGNQMTFTSSGLMVTNTAVSLGSQSPSCGSGASNVPCTQPVTLSFSLTAGNYPMYIAASAMGASSCPVGYTCSSASPFVFAGKAVNVAPVFAGSVASPAQLPGDGPGSYLIPAGSTRSFTYYGSVSNANLAGGSYLIAVTGIKFGTSTSNLFVGTITSGLGNLATMINLPAGNNNGGGSPISTSSLSIGPNDQVRTFTKSFMATPSSGSVLLAIAGDNKYLAMINGVPVAVTSGETGFYNPRIVDVTSHIVQGNNTIQVIADNMPDGNGAFPWSTNPGGVIFKVAGGSCTSSVYCLNGTVYAVSNGTEGIDRGSSAVIPSNQLYPAWTSIPGASWVWDSNLMGSSSSLQPTISLTMDSGSVIQAGQHIDFTYTVSPAGRYDVVYILVPSATTPRKSTGVGSNYDASWGGYNIGGFSPNYSISSFTPYGGIYIPSDIPNGTYSLTVYLAASGSTTGGSEKVPTLAAANSGMFTVTSGTTVNQASVTCPGGYICVVNGQTLSCPSGYACSYASYNCPSGYVCYTYNKPYSSPAPAPTPSPSPAKTVTTVTNPSPTPTPTPTPTTTTTSTKPSPTSSPSGSPYPSSSSQSLGNAATQPASAWQAFLQLFGF
ncbi:MAG: PKD domain-containing protein [Patescibacteria group bacterium]|nr:PKD domain-containing protein [Patescibacteria group bacterium]